MRLLSILRSGSYSMDVGCPRSSLRLTRRQRRWICQPADFWHRTPLCASATIPIVDRYSLSKPLKIFKILLQYVKDDFVVNVDIAVY